MNDRAQSGTLDARAALSAYLALSGIWLLLTAAYVWLALHRPGHGIWAGAAIAFVVGVAWVVWLRGFRLRISADHVEYRDGLYRSVVIPRREVTEARHTWIEWKVPGRHLRVPRLVIVYGDGRDSVAVNTKPFRAADLRIVFRELDAK